MRVREFDVEFMEQLIFTSPLNTDTWWTQTVPVRTRLSKTDVERMFRSRLSSDVNVSLYSIEIFDVSWNMTDKEIMNPDYDEDDASVDKMVYWCCLFCCLPCFKALDKFTNPHRPTIKVVVYLQVRALVLPISNSG